MKLSLSIFIFTILTYINQVQGFHDICRHLQVSTNITETKTDVIRNGVVKNEWKENAKNPMSTQTSLAIDYFYLTITNSHQKLKNKDLKLTVDDNSFQSTAEIIYSRDLGKNVMQYTVAIRYAQCKNKGGALLTYKLDILVPNCGQNSVFWKKYCGNLLQPRLGLTMELQIGQKLVQTIVKDGQLVNASYFSKDLDSLVFKVPKTQDETVFIIYMDDKMKEAEENIKKTDDVIEILSDAMMLLPEERLEPFFVDANEEIMNPVVKGKMVNGGMLTTQKTRFTLKYNCQRHGESDIQLQIPMTYFKDVNLFFVKECPHIIGTEFADFEQRVGFFYLIFLVFFFVLLGGTLYNVLIENKKGSDAIPFYTVSTEFLMQFTVVQEVTVKTRKIFIDSVGKLKKSDYSTLVGGGEQDQDAENQRQQQSQNSEIPMDNMDQQAQKRTEYGSL